MPHKFCQHSHRICVVYSCHQQWLSFFVGIKSQYALSTFEILQQQILQRHFTLVWPHITAALRSFVFVSFFLCVFLWSLEFYSFLICHLIALSKVLDVRICVAFDVLLLKCWFLPDSWAYLFYKYISACSLCDFSTFSSSTKPSIVLMLFKVSSSGGCYAP